MEHRQDLDGVVTDPVGDQEGCIGDDQLTRAPHSPLATEVRVGGKEAVALPIRSTRRLAAIGRSRATYSAISSRARRALRVQRTCMRPLREDRRDLVVARDLAGLGF